MKPGEWHGSDLEADGVGVVGNGAVVDGHPDTQVQPLALGWKRSDAHLISTYLSPTDSSVTPERNYYMLIAQDNPPQLRQNLPEGKRIRLYSEVSRAHKGGSMRKKSVKKRPDQDLNDFW